MRVTSLRRISLPLRNKKVDGCGAILPCETLVGDDSAFMGIVVIPLPPTQVQMTGVDPVANGTVANIKRRDGLVETNAWAPRREVILVASKLLHVMKELGLAGI
ncbi:unnamed protein product [Lupinus luteus]|uniref:Uncharacterized protein n=1 Tax=Lupinus luteus TaxID=3873 RepID=A0AAV1XEB9_LUPLU